MGQMLGIGEVMPIEGAVASAVNGTSVVVSPAPTRNRWSAPRAAKRRAKGRRAAPGRRAEAQGNEAPAASETPAG